MGKIKLYTIGYTKKSAQKFFSLLSENNVKRILDIRLRNWTQMCAFSKYPDIKYFSESIANIEYEHNPDLSPSQELFDGYMKKQISWSEYEVIFNNLLSERNIKDTVDFERLNGTCLLCCEDQPDQCHRRLVAEFFQAHNDQIEIVHIS